MLIVLTTAPDRALANELADKIVREKLAACVQILPQMTSVYFWDDEVQRDEEHLLLIKTSAEIFPTLEAFIQENHTYDTPEIIGVESTLVTPKYREWLENYLES